MRLRLQFSRLLWILLAIDAVLLGLHIAFRYSANVTDVRLSIEHEHGLAENFQYVKELGAAAFLAFFATRDRTVLFGYWAALFSYFFLDDAFQLHERIGARLVAELDLPGLIGMRPQDSGEVLVSGIVGVFFAVALLAGYRRAGEFARQVSRRLAVFVLLLAFFGIVVDIGQYALRPIPDWVARILVLVEDGGEMVVMSGTVAYVVGVYSEFVQPLPQRE